MSERRDDMLLIEVVECSTTIANLSSRNAKANHLADLLRRTSTPDELAIAATFLIGKLRQGRIGLGPSAIHAAKTTAADMPSLTLRGVDETFSASSQITGAGSVREKVRVMQRLFARATEPEQRFIASLVYGELHQGAMEGVMIESIAAAAHVTPSAVRRAVMATGDLAGVATSAMFGAPNELSKLAIELFRPVQPMLAQPASDATEAFSRDRPLVAELKLDGARIQVHKLDDDVRVYTRGLRDVTDAVPEVVSRVKSLPTRSLVLDGEVIALREDGRPLPFQTTMRRFGRKLDVDDLRARLPLTPFFFDLLYRDGEPVIDAPLAERSTLLSHLVGDSMIPRCLVETTEAAAQFLAGAIADGHEGIMLKALDSTYEAGARGSDWFKIKQVHTLDLVILAADWGHGRRTGWLSNLHLGARDPDTQSFVMLGKTFKGLTDKMLAWQTQRLLALEIARDRYTVHVKPELVAEVVFNEVQKSSRYPGGLALRFARIKRYREDKDATGVDSIHTVRSIHKQAVHGR